MPPTAQSLERMADDITVHIAAYARLIARNANEMELRNAHGHVTRAIYSALMEASGLTVAPKTIGE